jgi:hypothetical protein
MAHGQCVSLVALQPARSWGRWPVPERGEAKKCRPSEQVAGAGAGPPLRWFEELRAAPQVCTASLASHAHQLQREHAVTITTQGRSMTARGKVVRGPARAKFVQGLEATTRRRLYSQTGSARDVRHCAQLSRQSRIHRRRPRHQYIAVEPGHGAQ